MAEKQHLAVLNKGRTTWNEWRSQNPKVRPDLTEANLSRADLSEANLAWADLTEADLTEANLSRADLTGANLSEADLTGANLSEANLSWANLAWADLSGAVLSGANLMGAILTEADLSAANLTGAVLSMANLAWADLSGAALSGAHLFRAKLNKANLTEADLDKANLTEADLFATVLINTDLTETEGLDQCRHHGPSTIDHRTILKSGRLPLAFLRGCGLPDSLIDYLPSLLNQPIQFYACFISYASADQGFAERLHADLQNKGVRCWYAPEDMKIGENIRERIDESVQIFDKLLLILSKHSITSQWVEQEVETALRKERERKRTFLFPIRLDDTVMKVEGGWPALIRNTRHIGDFREWEIHSRYQAAFARLLRDLKLDEPKAEA